MTTRLFNICFNRALIILFLHIIFTNTLMLQAQDTSLPVGAVPGVIDVSPMGAATYTIPIEVVPGTMGMQPNLSIVYNSMGGMGLLGMKWNLAGLSAITRCGQMSYYDNGNITAIQFNDNDRFALDGDRLIRLNIGAYGVVGGEYATEVENFTRVVSYRGTTGHPEYFEAYTDDGSIIQYGNGNNSRQNLGSGSNSTLSWFVNKITDANNNYMTFHYGQEQTNGEIWINEIRYTGNGFSPYAKVKFDYIDLPDDLGKNTYFVGGYGVPQTKLLNSITVSYNNDIVRKYRFNYNISDSGERTTHLKEVILFGENDQIRLNSTTIAWGGQNNNIEDSPLSNFSTGSIITGDFNGDGYTDYVVYNIGSGVVKSWKLFLFNPNNNSFQERSSGNTTEAYAYAHDFDGDGKDELILAELHSTVNNYKNYQFNVYHYDNNAWIIEPLEFVAHFSQPHFGDFTGDGIMNIMYVSSWVDGNKIKYLLSFSNNGFSSSDLPFEDIDNIQIIDYNGNGKANIQITKGNNTDIYEYSATNQKFEIVTTRNYPTSLNKILYGDFNGDGISDIIELYSTVLGIQPIPGSLVPAVVYGVIGGIQFGNGSGYYESGGSLVIYFNDWWNNGFIFLPKYSLYIADINGDGKDDIIQAIYDEDTKQTTFYIYYSKGYANGQYQFTSKIKVIAGDYSDYNNVKPSHLWYLGDFNGDGKNDLFIRKSKTDTNPKIIYFNKNEQYEYATAFIDGLGKKNSIIYTPKYLSFTSPSQNQKKKFFVQLPTEIQTPNGIGNDVTKLQFRYWDPVYSFERRAFLGFSQFATISTIDNIKSIDSLLFSVNLSREILLPQNKFHTKNVAPYTINQITYTYNIVSLPNQRFVLHNDLARNQDYLSDAKTETTTTLENGRIKTSNTKTFNGSNSTTWMHSETNTYTYNTITLNGYQKKTVPTQILTTQQFGNNGVIIADTLTCNYSGTGRLNWQRQGNIDGSITTTYRDYSVTGVYREKTVLADDCNPRKEYYEHDPVRRFVTKVTNHIGHSANIDYDPKTGNKLSETDINGLTTTYKYDAFGNLTQINYPDGTQTNISIRWHTVSYLKNSRYYIKTTSTGKPTLEVYYDILGREVCRLEDKMYFETRYNAKGQVDSVSYPFSGFSAPDIVWRAYTYDSFGRKLTEKAPYTDLSYTYNNRRITTIDHLRNDILSYKDYDALGRIVQAKDEGGIIDYSYSMITSNGKPRQQTSISTNGATTTILSDLWGNRLSISEPNAGLITSKYNGFNELMEQIDAHGHTTKYEYDRLGRVTQKQFTISNTLLQTINYTYDNYSSSYRGRGKLHQIKIDGEVAEIFDYNNLSRLRKYTKIIDGSTYSHRYIYTATGQLDTLIYPDYFTINYKYTPTGKLDEIRRSNDNSLIYKVNLRNNKYDVPIRCEYGNGVVTDYTYNPDGLITRIKTGNKITSIPVGNDDRSPFISEPAYTVDSAILNYRYVYNNKSLMISRSESVINRLETYEYDNLDRLAEIKSGAIGTGTMQTQTFLYNNNGNINSNSNVGLYTYVGKPHAVIRIVPINNNVISQNQCDVTYNFFNQPTQITEGAHEILLSYGSNQQRQKAVQYYNNSIANTHYYISKYCEKEIDAANNRTSLYYYIYGDNGVVAMRVFNSANKMYYIHTDHLGNYCAITDADKQVVQSNRFDPWGNIIGTANFTLTKRGFTGHEHYPELKIINMNGRLYDPVIGRFFSPDNYVQFSGFTQGYNRYSYALNNPLKYVDPTGQWLDEYNYNLSTGDLTWLNFNGGDFFQTINLTNANGSILETLTIPGNHFDIASEIDDMGKVNVAARGGGLAMSDGVSSGSFAYSNTFFIAPPANDLGSAAYFGIDYTMPTDFTIPYRAPASGMINYSSFNVGDAVFVGLFAKSLYYGAKTAISGMVAASRASSQAMIAEATQMAAREGMVMAKGGTNFVEQVAVHGNSLQSMRPTWGYKLYSTDGTFLKNGITSQIIPQKRYTQKFMFDKTMKPIKQFPNRLDAWQWELEQNLILRGPLNLNLH